MKYLLIFFLSLTLGCASVGHMFTPGSPTEHSEWAKGETVRLSKLYGTSPTIPTRFLDIPAPGGVHGWAEPHRITVTLRNQDGTPRSTKGIHRVWYHEWYHHKEGIIRITPHDQEFQTQLKALNLWPE